MNKSDEIKDLAAALAKAQAQITGADKGGKTDAYRKGSKYATLQDAWDACREPLTKNGLSVVQTTDTSENGMVLESILMHSSGQWISSVYPINPEKPGPQGLGSCMTYARRYSLMALVSVTPNDASEDDGNAATDFDRPHSTPNRLTAAPPARSIADLEDEGREAAEGGLVPLQAWWARLSPQHKVGLQKFKDDVLKPIAEKAA